MKRFFVIITSLLLVICAFIYINKDKEKNNDTVESIKKVKVAEVTHSMFYAPLYVALENGYFKDEGLDVELVLTSGADKVSAATLSGDAQIGFAGPESAIYIYNNGEKDYLVTFAGLTKRDGQFIVSREKIDNFKIEDLYGKEVLGGRKGGMPILNFINGVKNSNADLSKIKLNDTVDFASLSGTFLSGVGDFVNLFEPTALKLESEGLGYVVASVGELSGEMPYTAFYTKKSYLDNNKDTIEKFNKAINKGLEYVKNNSEKDIAESIAKQFPDNTLNDIEKIVKRYKDNDSWLTNTTINEDIYKNLENIMIDNDLLDDYVDFNKLVVNLND